MVIFIQIEFDERRKRQRPKRPEVDDNEEKAEGPDRRAFIMIFYLYPSISGSQLDRIDVAGEHFYRIKVAAQKLCGNIRISKKKLSFIKSVNLAVLIYRLRNI